MRWIIGAACMLGTVVGALGQQEYFRQYFEAEDCALENLTVYRNPLSSYSGDRFAYNMFSQPGEGSIRAPLARTLAPGPVRVFVRVYSEGEPESRTITARLGGAEASVSYPTESYPRGAMNWLALELTTVQPAEELRLTVASPRGGRLIVDCVLVSTDPGDGVYFERGQSRLLPRQQPTPEQVAWPESEGNMLFNSGFEVAPTGDWRAGYQSQWALTDELLVGERAYEGERCLQVPFLRDRRAWPPNRWQTYDGIYSAPVQLTAGERYTASIYVRTDGPISGAIGLKSKSQKFNLEASDDWQRIWATVAASEETDSFYLTISADGPRRIFLDAAQLERGELSEYSARAGVEVGIGSGGRAGRVWREGEPVSLTWEARACSAPAEATVRYLIHDALGRVHDRGQRNISAPAGQTVRLPLLSGPHPTGSYRVAYTVEVAGLPAHSGQACFAVIPATRGRTAQTIGLYASHTEQCFAAMSNAGITWTNTLSSGGHFAEWTYVEPEDDVFVFHDEDIELARKYGIRILANINTSRSSMPKWVLHDQPGAEGEWIRHPMGYFDLAEWEEFVFALVQHYRDYVKHWLVLDEPDAGTNRYSPEDYLKMLRAAQRAAKRADPESVVLVHTGTDSSFRATLLPLLEPGDFEVQYTYIGRFEREIGLQRGAEGHLLGKPLWTVEYGGVEKLSTHLPEVSAETCAPWAAVADNVRHSLRWGVRGLSWGRAEKWFRYDARYPGPPPGVRYMSLWEHDGSLTPLGVALATLNALIGDAQPQGEVSMPGGVEGHLWSDGDRHLLVAWTEDGTSRRLNLPGARAWDVCGGQLPEPVISYLPTFVEFTGPLPELEAEMVERVNAQLLPPEAAGEPYRARFAAAVRGPAEGEWWAAGPYLLDRDRPQRIPAQVAADGRAEIILPLNVWANLPIRDRQVEAKLYLPGRVLSGVLEIDTAAQ